MNNPKNSLPNGWSLKKLREIAKIQGGFAFDSKKFQNAGLYQVIKMSNLYGGNLDLERSQSFINSLSSREREYLLKPNEILITLTGTVGKRDYGYTFQITNEEHLLLNQRVARIIANTELSNPKYVFYELNTNRFLNQFFYVAKGGTGNQANVGIEDISNIQLVLPPLPEQQKIATILGTWDAAIQTTTALLAALQKRKKGLMQQLLSPKSDWKEVRLGEVAVKIASGGTPSTTNETFWTGTIPWISGADFENQKIKKIRRFITIEAVENSSTVIAEKDSLLIVTRTGVGKIAIAPFDVAISQDITVLKLNTQVKIDFIFHFLDFFSGKLSSQNQGTSIAGLTRESLINLQFSFPPLAEQTRIAAILNAADAELRQTEAYLEKLKTQKRGLMQQLLTGKVRVTTT